MFNQTARMLLLGVVFLCGCAHDEWGDAPPARVDEPIGVQMMRLQPQLRTQRFNNLLSFEAKHDVVFVSGAAPGAVVQDSTRAHTGRSSVRVNDGVLAIRLWSLVKPGTLPGQWTLAGAYFYSPQGAEMSISCQLDGAPVAQRKLTLPAGKWTAAMVDLALLSEMKPLVQNGALSAIVFEIDSSEPMWCDDFVLIDNSQTLFGEEDSKPSLSSDWLIKFRGLNYTGTSPGRFNFKLLAAEYSNIGWKPQEINAKRARFSSAGPQKSVTIYSDGRAYWDGEYRPLSAGVTEPPFSDAHRNPGQIELSEEFGRVDRNTPGDANNDGYNESRGSYQVVASGARVELNLTPRGVPLMRPVLEIRGMPPGSVMVNIEGRQIDDAMRLDDGTVLIDLPAKINRATTVSVKVQ